MAWRVAALYGGTVSAEWDDFAEYLLKVPGAYAYLGTGDPDRPGTQGPAHNGAFDLDEDALPMGAALYADYALGWLRGVFD